MLGIAIAMVLFSDYWFHLSYFSTFLIWSLLQWLVKILYVLGILVMLVFSTVITFCAPLLFLHFFSHSLLREKVKSTWVSGITLVLLVITAWNDGEWLC